MITSDGRIKKVSYPPSETEKYLRECEVMMKYIKEVLYNLREVRDISPRSRKELMKVYHDLYGTHKKLMSIFNTEFTNR